MKLSKTNLKSVNRQVSSKVDWHICDLVYWQVDLPVYDLVCSNLYATLFWQFSHVVTNQLNEHFQ